MKQLSEKQLAFIKVGEWYTIADAKAPERMQMQCVDRDGQSLTFRNANLTMRFRLSCVNGFGLLSGRYAVETPR
jgi:hypothetical protein